ncbi:phosphoribosyltransferase domain-containing protein [bacterium]|nr:phosphoribosyltransferase domain-containing protein [bacterium]
MPDRIIQKEFITYQRYGEMAGELTEKLKGERFTKIYGPPRGGLPLAVHCAHHLDLPLVCTEEFISNMNKWLPSDRLLVVDDIIDNGKTISVLDHMLRIRKIAHFTAVLFYKPHAVFKPDLYLETTDKWIVFPWERPDEERSL